MKVFVCLCSGVYILIQFPQIEYLTTFIVNIISVLFCEFQTIEHLSLYSLLFYQRYNRAIGIKIHLPKGFLICKKFEY